MVNAGTYSEIDEILDRQRRRSDELDVETEAAQAALQADIDERQNVLDEQVAEAERKEAERREAEQAVLRERAASEQISIGETSDDDPFAGQATSASWAGVPPSRPAPEPQPQQPQPQQSVPANDPKWQGKAGRFGRRDEKDKPADRPAASTPPPKPAPRRRQIAQEDWDDDFSGRSWLQ